VTPPLACTVRDCGLLLERRGATFLCARNHSYDVARRGYINLLQPQDRRSLDAGDSREAVEARARLLAAGIGRTILDGFVERSTRLVAPRGVVADLGSGSGELLALMSERMEVVGVGIDLSTAAIEHAARNHPALTWVVANADRRLPLLDRSVDLVVSMHGRRNPEECARVLIQAAHLVVAVPAPDDLVELREQVQGRAVERDRAESLILEHSIRFELIERFALREQRLLDKTTLRDLLRGTYRGERVSAAARIDALESLRVTLASEVLVFAVKKSGRA
jgi:23S rRNA (guanine745-N1)-methyltransferase